MFLVCFQFVPAIRHRLMIFHRINGYVIILLTLVANAGALMIARRAFGGRIETQVGVGVLVILSTLGIAVCIPQTPSSPRSADDGDRTPTITLNAYRSSNIVLGCSVLVSAFPSIRISQSSGHTGIDRKC